VSAPAKAKKAEPAAETEPLPWDAQPKPAARPAAPKLPSAPAESCTADEAWEAVIEARGGDITDDDLTTIWLNAIKEIAPGGVESALTPAGWYEVKEAVIDKIGGPF